MTRFNPIRFLALLLLPGLLFQCSRELDLEIPEVEPEPVVNANFTVGEPVHIELSMSGGTGEYTSLDPVVGAEVRIYEDGQLHTDLEEELVLGHGSFPMWQGVFWSGADQDRYFPVLKTTDLRVKEESEYRIEVDIPGYETISGQTVAPETPSWEILSSVDSPVVWGNAIYMDTIHFIRTKLRVYDDGSELRYYHLSPRAQKDSLSPFRVAPVRSNDEVLFEYFLNIPLIVGDFEFYNDDSPVQHNNGYPPLFSNRKFKNGYHDFELTYNKSGQFEEDGARHIYCLYRLESEYFEFLRASFQQKALLDNPFSEPVLIPSNVVNALGVVAGTAVDTIPIN